MNAVQAGHTYVAEIFHPFDSKWRPMSRHGKERWAASPDREGVWRQTIAWAGPALIKQMRISCVETGDVVWKGTEHVPIGDELPRREIDPEQTSLF